MKTTFYLAIVLVISFIVIPTNIPKEYPPQPVMDQRESLVLKEAQIDRLIHQIKYQLVKDSIQIKALKNEQQSKTN